MTMLKHFTDSLGSMLGVIVAIAITIYFVKLIFYRRAKAPAYIWRKYLNDVITDFDPDYIEAAKLHKLLDGKDSKDLIKTPKGYKVIKWKKIEVKERLDDTHLIELKDAYTIRKKFK